MGSKKWVSQRKCIQINSRMISEPLLLSFVSDYRRICADAQGFRGSDQQPVLLGVQQLMVYTAEHPYKLQVQP